MSESLRDEFRLSALGFNYPDPDAFVRPQWRCRRSVYLLWRSLWLVWHVAITVASAVNFWDKVADSTHEGFKWFIDYPHLTFIATVIACTCDLIGAGLAGPHTAVATEVSARDNSRSSSIVNPDKEEILFQGGFIVLKGLEPASTPLLSQVTWLLYNIINCSNILSTAWFWAVTYDSHTYAVEIVAHLINSVFVISNLLVSAMPVRLIHGVYPVIYTGLYIAFTAIYHAVDGSDVHGKSDIYPQLDWNEAFPTVVTVVIGLLVVIPLLHCVVFALFTFRVYVFASINSASYSPRSRSETAVTGVRYQERSGVHEVTIDIDHLDRDGSSSVDFHKHVGPSAEASAAK
ncbi:protein rolling stone [Plakobranchus ocellatus]|uniref:Protein rolling stone n=1 Tax=Plakobranchus ocellatus TaxID=259542 RepID=A0AAV4DIZ6_9GAST|nr:protein rolling stone [Plakobranchus ocellatus]